jgi:AraC-like DNA-binding protein
MCELGIKAENFNPQIYFTFKRKFDESHVTNIHTHDFVSMVYVLSGACSYSIGGGTYHVKKGDVLVFDPDVPHGKTVKPGEEIMELHIGFGNICVEGLPKNHLVPEGSSPVFHLQEYEQSFLSCCSDICTVQEDNSPGCELMIKVHAMRFIVLFLQATRSQTRSKDRSLAGFDSSEKAVIVNTLMKYLNENYMRQISLETISKSIYLSPAYISKVFREEIGESPINYLIKIRLSKARELLMEGGHSIKEVARAVGYEDAYYFSKLYKKYNNVSPSKVKKPSE